MSITCFPTTHTPPLVLQEVTAVFVKNISLSEIKPPTFDTRTKESPVEDAELMESIKQLGVLEPICVKKDFDGYEVIYGHRRLRMSVRLCLPTIPCIVVKPGDKELELMKIHENLHTLPVSHVDQGRTFQYLRDTFNMTESAIALLVNKSIAYISQHLTLLSTDPDIIEAVHSDEISFSVARSLAGVKDGPDRKRLFDVAKESGATAPIVENWKKESNRDHSPDPGEIKYVPDDNAPPYQNTPNFPCQCCNQLIPISQLQILRLCPDCNFNFKSAISQIKTEESDNQTPPTPV